MLPDDCTATENLSLAPDDSDDATIIDDGPVPRSWTLQAQQQRQHDALAALEVRRLKQKSQSQQSHSQACDVPHVRGLPVHNVRGQLQLCPQTTSPAPVDKATSFNAFLSKLSSSHARSAPSATSVAADSSRRGIDELVLHVSSGSTPLTPLPKRTPPLPSHRCFAQPQVARAVNELYARPQPMSSAASNATPMQRTSNDPALAPRWNDPTDPLAVAIQRKMSHAPATTTQRYAGKTLGDEQFNAAVKQSMLKAVIAAGLISGPNDPKWLSMSAQDAAKALTASTNKFQPAATRELDEVYNRRMAPPLQSSAGAAVAVTPRPSAPTHRQPTTHELSMQWQSNDAATASARAQGDDALRLAAEEKSVSDGHGGTVAQHVRTVVNHSPHQHETLVKTSAEQPLTASLLKFFGFKPANAAPTHTTAITDLASRSCRNDGGNGGGDKADGSEGWDLENLGNDKWEWAPLNDDDAKKQESTTMGGLGEWAFSDVELVARRYADGILRAKGKEAEEIHPAWAKATPSRIKNADEMMKKHPQRHRHEEELDVDGMSDIELMQRARTARERKSGDDGNDKGNTSTKEAAVTVATGGLSQLMPSPAKPATSQTMQQPFNRQRSQSVVEQLGSLLGLDVGASYRTEVRGSIKWPKAKPVHQQHVHHEVTVRTRRKRHERSIMSDEVREANEREAFERAHQDNNIEFFERDESLDSVKLDYNPGKYNKYGKMGKHVYATRRAMVHAKHGVEKAHYTGMRAVVGKRHMKTKMSKTEASNINQSARIARAEDTLTEVQKELNKFEAAEDRRRRDRLRDQMHDAKLKVAAGALKRMGIDRALDEDNPLSEEQDQKIKYGKSLVGISVFIFAPCFILFCYLCNKAAQQQRSGNGQHHSSAEKAMAALQILACMITMVTCMALARMGFGMITLKEKYVGPSLRRIVLPPWMKKRTQTAQSTWG